MALSEHEQRVLDELERGLYADDEQLARRLQKVSSQTLERRRQRFAAKAVAGASLALAGLGVLLVGTIVHYVWMGVGGFALTLAGLLVATGSRRGSAASGFASANSAGSNSASGAANSGTTAVKEKADRARRSLFDFFEERWDRRANGS